MRVLLIGYGRMGRLVESLSGEYGVDVVGRIGRVESARPGEWPGADVAIDFSTADAVPANLARLAARRTAVVIGTTGWRGREAELRREAEASGIGVVAAPNFAIGVNLFALLVERAGALLNEHPGFGSWIHELHHAAKRDAPSGTARQLEDGAPARRIRPRRRYRVHARRRDPGHAHGGIRQRRRDHHADPHGPRSLRLRARRARGGKVGAGAERLVRHEGRTPTDVRATCEGGTRMRRPFTGCGTALVTPFLRGGALDEAGVRRLARRQIDAGVHFLVPCGTTGETPTLTGGERARVVDIVVSEAAGRLPVLAGAGGYNTQEVIESARRMAEAGADGILSVTPYYNKPTPEGLFQHYAAIGEAVPLPIIVYNVPGRTGCNVDVATILRLSTIPNVVGVKEASGNMTQMCEICASVPPGFLVLSGDDALTLPVMAVGGAGIVSVASNEVPAEMALMVERAEQGDFAAARRLHTELLPLMLVNFVESSPIPVKAAMAAMGLLEEIYRLPLVPPRPASRERIGAVLRGLGLPGSLAVA